MALLAITAAIEIGSLIYRLVDRPSTPKPPLANLQISNAQSGAPIPFGYGTVRFAGQIIWTPGITYTKVNGSKKGGPSIVTYLYFASFAAAFGEGPGTIGRLWGDSKLIYDPNPTATSALDVANYPAWDSTITYNPGADVAYGGSVWECILLNAGQIPSAPGSTFWLQIGDYPNWSNLATYSNGDVVTFNGQLWVAMNPSDAASPVTPGTSTWSPSNLTGTWTLMNNYYPAPTIYPGDNLQNPDPLIQASEGSDNTPANRGLIYSTFDTFPLQNFGGRIPNVRGEVTFTKTANIL
jgi:hypothetical protein